MVLECLVLSLVVPWPGEDRARQISAKVEALGRRVELAVQESRTLAELRDALLPKLMSGEINVVNAEKVVEGAV
jgi:type I restriction enzyme S subunit